MNVESLQGGLYAGALETKARGGKAEGFKGFEELFDKATKTKEDKDNQIQAIIQNIDELKSTLDNEGLTLENLNNYKEAVRSFLNYYTKNELQMESQTYRDNRGFTSKLTMVKSLDEKLDDLAENMLETHQGHLDTLNKIGEIHGLIVNLFM